jgi:hypothetical protein
MGNLKLKISSFDSIMISPCFTFRAKQSNLDHFALKVKIVLSFKMSGTAHPTTPLHIPEDFNLPQHCFENRMSFSAST